jgi:hypothetical protein
MYKKEGSNINPLMLIQLPDNKSNLVSKKEDVIKILDKKGITEKNGKLAIWLCVSYAFLTSFSKHV